jgi:hypothetical protein
MELNGISFLCHSERSEETRLPMGMTLWKPFEVSPLLCCVILSEAKKPGFRNRIKVTR